MEIHVKKLIIINFFEFIEAAFTGSSSRASGGWR